MASDLITWNSLSKKILHNLSNSDFEELCFTLFQFLQIPLQSSCVHYARHVNLVFSLHLSLRFQILTVNPPRDPQPHSRYLLSTNPRFAFLKNEVLQLPYFIGALTQSLQNTITNLISISKKTLVLSPYG